MTREHATSTQIWNSPPAATGRRTTAELPQLGRGSLVLIYEVVQVELVDVAGHKLGEAGAYVLEQCPQLRLVIAGDPLARRPSIGLLT